MTVTSARTGLLRCTGMLCVVGVVAVAAVAFAVWSTVRAFDARQLAGEAGQLQVAALSLASADALAAAGGTPDLDEVARSVDTIMTNERAALALLSTDDAAEADHLLDDIAACGVGLLGPSGHGPHVHGHDELLGLLYDAAETGRARAADATRNALVAAGVAGLAGLLGAGLITSGAARRRREAIVAQTEAAVGQRLTTVLDDWPDGFVVALPDGTFAYRSPSSSAFIDPAVSCVEDLVAAVADEQSEAFRRHLATGARQRAATFDLRTPDGSWIAAEVRVSDLEADPVVHGRSS